MTTTIEIPSELAARVESAASARGVPFAEFVSAALAEKVAHVTGDSVESPGERPWMRFFGIASDLKDELARIDRVIEEEFENIEPEDRS